MNMSSVKILVGSRNLRAFFVPVVSETALSRLPVCVRRSFPDPNHIISCIYESKRFFQAPPKSPVASRRRKKYQRSESNTTDDSSSGNKTEESSEKQPSMIQGLRHPAVLDSATFDGAADALLEKVHTALQPLQYSNDPFVLTRGHEDDVGDFVLMDLGPVLGQYTIQIDNENKVLLLQSPISGQVMYVLSARTGEWVGEDDGHSFEGLLVRDLIRQCNGVPNL